MARPSAFPDFATDDVTDPVSHQPNVSEPPSDNKTEGWKNGQYPPRQYMNWLHRVVNNWLKWLDSITASHNTSIGTLQGQMTTANGNISTLQGQMTTANTNISTLQNEIDAINAPISYFRCVLPTGRNLDIGYIQYASGLVKLYWTPVGGLDSGAVIDAAGTPVPADSPPVKLRPASDRWVPATFFATTPTAQVVPGIIVIKTTGAVSLQSYDGVTVFDVVQAGVQEYFVG
jgi:hypothetical protein